MNITTAEHLKECFPEVDSSKFDTFYFSKASDEDYVFIAIKGQLEDIQIFQKGEYNEESLERRLFAITSKYAPAPSSDTFSLYDEDPQDEFEVREEMINPGTKEMSDILKFLAILAILVICEAIAVFFCLFVGLERTYFPYLIGGLIVFDVLLYFIYRKPSIKGSDYSE